MKLLINLATRGRPQIVLNTIQRTLPNITNPETVFMVSVDSDDQTTIDILKDLPGITLNIRPREDSVGEKFNRALATEADLYMVMVDYVPHLTPGFDQKIIDANTFPDGIGVIYSHLANASFPTLNVVTRRYAELTGGIYPTYFPYWFIDHWLDDVARMVDRINFVDVLVDISNKQPTMELRDISFWTQFYDAKEPERLAQANEIINHLLEPSWRKKLLRESFPLVTTRSRIINASVRQSMGTLGTIAADDRYTRILEHAKTLVPEVKVAEIKKSPSILIFMPSYNPPDVTTMVTVQKLTETFHHNGIKGSFATAGLALIGELRNVILTLFYDKTDASHLLFIDSDIGFPPELVMEMLAFNEPLVGSMYPQRSLPLVWAGSGKEGPTQLKGNFLELDGVGMGCTLIRRDLVATMLEKMPQLSDPRIAKHPAEHYLKSAGVSRIIRAFDNIDVPDLGIVHEDLAFCHRWRQCGGRVWANVGHRVSHMGLYDFGARYKDHLPEAIAA